MNFKRVLPLLVLSISACSPTPKPEPIPVVSQERACPAYPLPSADLLNPPVKTDFLTPTSAPPKASSSTN